MSGVPADHPLETLREHGVEMGRTLKASVVQSSRGEEERSLKEFSLTSAVEWPLVSVVATSRGPKRLFRTARVLLRTPEERACGSRRPLHQPESVAVSAGKPPTARAALLLTF